MTTQELGELKELFKTYQEKIDKRIEVLEVKTENLESKTQVVNKAPLIKNPLPEKFQITIRLGNRIWNLNLK